MEEGIYFTENDGKKWKNVLKLNSIAHFIKADHEAPRNIYILGSSLIKFTDTVTVTGINGELSNIPLRYSLKQNYPNPFNPITTIEYSIPDVERNTVSLQSKGRFGESLYKVSLKVYDVLGNEIAELVNGYREPGSYIVKFDGSRLASGTYLVSLQAGEFKQSRKILLMK